MSQDKTSLDELRINRNDLEEEGSSRSKLWIILIVLILLGVVAFVVVSQRIPEVRTVAVRAAADTAGGRTVLNASGYVVARRQATVSSKVTGKVVEILVEEGMKVEANQVLARLDDSNVQASLHLAEAQAAAAKAALGETQARLDVAEKEATRLRDLAKQNITTQSAIDQGEGEVKSLKARLLLQQEEIGVAEKQVALWRQQQEDTIIRAPFAGIAVSKNAQAGEMISPVSAGGGFTRTGIGTVVDMDSLEIEVDVNENYLHRVKNGQPVEATLDAYPDWKIACKVFAIIPTADRQKSTVKVRVKFDQLDPRILPDMGVKVAFQGTDTETSAAEQVVIPEAAVRKENGKTIALVLEDGRVRVRPVSGGIARSGELALNGGFKAGEKVIVEGPPDLAEGQRVREKSK